MFYHNCLRSVLGVDRELRLEVLFVVAACPPLRVLLGKAVMQYV